MKEDTLALVQDFIEARKPQYAEYTSIAAFIDAAVKEKLSREGVKPA